MKLNYERKPFLLTPSSELERKQVGMLFFVVAFLVVFDAVASIVVIDVLGIAFEGNGILQSLAEVYGFIGAMGFRVWWGVSCVLLLAALCLYFAAPEKRKFAIRGLWLILFVHIALMIYHTYVMVLGITSQG